MAKLKISAVEIIGKLQDSKAIVDYLQRKGVVQLIKTDYEDVTFNEFSSTVSQFDRFYSDANEALSIINKYSPEKKGLIASLTGREEISLDDLLLKSEKADEALSVCSEINDLEKQIVDSRVEIQRNNVSMDILKPWMTLDIPTNYRGTQTTAVFLGTLPGQLTREDVLTSIATSVPDSEACDVTIVSSEKGQTCIAVFAERKIEKAVEEHLRQMGFNYPTDPTKHPPKVRYERLEARNEQLQKDISDVEEKLAAFAGERENIKFLCDYLLLRKEKYQALSMFGMTDSVFVITCYSAEKYAVKFKEKLESEYACSVEIKDVAEDDENVPVILENNAFAKPVQNIVGMFALPSKTDIDPTSITAIFYYFFFGMMLSDAGYGLMMVVVLSILLKKYKFEESMRNNLKMFLYCGISTVFWGAMYGSWWGDMFSVINVEFLGGEPLNLALWMDPLARLMDLMVWCFGFGVVHLFVGVGAKGYSLLKQGRKFDAFCETIPTYVFIIGVAPIFLNLFTTVPEGFSKISPYILAVGAVLVIATAGRASKSIGGKIGQGLYGLYNLVSGYLGDVLSYSRLLALGLATGIIAQVMNMLGTIATNTVVKLLMFIVVSIVGHTVNIAINLIGAYVHTIRLQYVEFYAKFYDGGGIEFKPLSLKTQYYRLKTDSKSKIKEF
ncbi:MAG: V-type ATP synthase subunit I [Clostridia bacterium]|nr:V-type ATP synthase subunit I [Clostridia bacterium]